MKWEIYCRKLNEFDWTVSTAVKNIPLLENLGTAEELVDIIITIGNDDTKGAAKLLDKALQAGMRFTVDQVVDICNFCEPEAARQAMLQSADKFTAQDLEDLYQCVDDEWIIEAAKRYRITAPEELRYRCKTEDETVEG